MVKVNLDTLKECTSNKKTFEVRIGNHQPIQVRNRLNLEDSAAFVEAIVNNIMASKVVFAIKDYVIKYYTIEFYTNVEIPEDGEFREWLIMESGLVERIIKSGEFDTTEYNKLLKYVDEQLAYEIEAQQNRFASQTEEYIEQVQFECEQVIKSFEQFTEVFKGIKPEEIKVMLKNFSKKDFSTKSIVQALKESQDG